MGAHSALPEAMSKAAPPSVLPTATVFALTATLLKVTFAPSPVATVFRHSFLPAARSIAAIWCSRGRPWRFFRFADSLMTAAMPSALAYGCRADRAGQLHRPAWCRRSPPRSRRSC